MSQAIPDLLKDWLIDNYGERVHDEFVLLRERIPLPLYRIPYVTEDPYFWISSSFYWDEAGGLDGTHVSGNDWAEIDIEWKLYVESL